MHLLIITQKVDATDSNLGFFVQWIEALSKRMEITVIANEVHRDARGYLAGNIHIESLGKERGASRISRFRSYRRLLREHLPKVDGIFFHMCPEYVLAAGMLPKSFGKKTLLWYVHREVTWRLLGAAFLVDKIFTASEKSCRLQSKKIEVVGHGIDTKIFSPRAHPSADPSALRLITVGRISPVKDIRTLILGFLNLKKRLPAVSLRLAILGEPITESDKRYEAELKGLKAVSPGQFVWGRAHHGNVPEFYLSVESGRTVFVHASRTGSIDKAVLEALAAGLPVFTSSEAFPEEIPGVTKFREGDSADLAEKIACAFEQGRLVIQEKGRAFVREHHSLEHLISRISAFFSSQGDV